MTTNNDIKPGTELTEKPPIWFPMAPIMVIVSIWLLLLVSGKIVGYLGLPREIPAPLILRGPVGGFLCLIGPVFFLWGFALLRPEAALGLAKRLRTTGAYALTRNPMYFGVNSAFWGVGILLGMTHVLIAALLWSATNYSMVVLWEEKQLQRKFGEEYLEYKSRVPRFIPRLKRFW